MTYYVWLISQSQLSDVDLRVVWNVCIDFLWFTDCMKWRESVIHFQCSAAGWSSRYTMIHSQRYSALSFMYYDTEPEAFCFIMHILWYRARGVLVYHVYTIIQSQRHSGLSCTTMVQSQRHSGLSCIYYDTEPEAFCFIMYILWYRARGILLYHVYTMVQSQKLIMQYCSVQIDQDHCNNALQIIGKLQFPLIFFWFVYIMFILIYKFVCVCVCVCVCALNCLVFLICPMFFIVADWRNSRRFFFWQTCVSFY